MFLKGQDYFANITQVLPAQNGWRACFTNCRFSDYIILPVIAWVFGMDYPPEDGGQSFPIAAGMVYAHAIGGEMVLAPANDYFMCYLSPEDDENTAYWKKLLKRRLAHLQKAVPETQQEEDETLILDGDTRTERMRNVKRMPIEIDMF
jgi:hypothetical protein